MKKNKFNTSSNLFNTLTFLKKKKCKKEEKIKNKKTRRVHRNNRIHKI